jgi:uncharacterized protein
MTEKQKIDAFLEGDRFAVVGASKDRSKYGNKVLRVYVQKGRDVVAVNPHEDTIENVQTYAKLSDVPGSIHGISVITPPQVTESIVQEAIDLGIKHIWMQPGAESDKAIEIAERGGAQVIAGGACILVVLGFREG